MRGKQTEEGKKGGRKGKMEPSQSCVVQTNIHLLHSKMSRIIIIISLL